MDQNDRHAIEGLFGKLSAVERQAGARDNEAESFIRERIAAQPGAPYFMAQTIVVQEQALDSAQRRIEELEYELANRQQPASGGGLLSSIFGSGSRPAPQAAPRRPAPPVGIGGPASAMSPAPSGPWGQSAPGQPSAFGQQAARPAGGGFLAGAAQTAMGVAGGVLLGNAIGGMFAGDTANAAPQPAAEPAPAEEAADSGDDGMDDMEF